MISILYHDNENSISEKFFSELKIGNSAEKICRNTEKLKIFVNVLSSPLTDGACIVKRQRVLKDVIEHQEGFSNVISLLERLSEFYKQYEANKKKNLIMSTQSTIENDISINSSFLDLSCFLLKRSLLLLKEISKTIEVAGFSCEGFLALKKRINEIVSDKNLNEIVDVISRFDSFSLNQSQACFGCTVGENGRCENIFFLEIQNRLFENKLSLISKLKNNKPEYVPDNDVRLDLSRYDRNIFIGTMLKKQYQQIEHYNKLIMEEFGVLKNEFAFYDAALRYCLYLKEHKIEYCFPEYSENASITELKDLYLSVMTEDTDNVVGNDFKMKNKDKAFLVLGDNNSGKTVYLRSIATAILFYQSGLPICAKEAQMFPFNDLHLHMSSEESENGEGRFEDEVRELSETLIELRSGSIVFINEIFQSTSYTEGEKALYDIINYMSDIGVFSITVTHLSDISGIENKAYFLKEHSYKGFLNQIHNQTTSNRN